MRRIVWNEEKSKLLRNDPTRGHVGFEECAAAIVNGDILDEIPNPSSKFPHQTMYIIRILNYAYVVPFVGDENEIFLKTLYPSRDYTKIYLEDKKNG